jgi:SAM-dependent methyltransferase
MAVAPERLPHEEHGSTGKAQSTEPHLEAGIDRLYRHRFPTASLERRAQVWRVLAREWLGHYIPRDGSVLELGAGYCEFINAVEARERVAVDINPETRQHVQPGVTVHELPAERLTERVTRDHFDVVFMSNFMEHCRSRDAVLMVLRAVHEVLKPGGRVIILGPNFRFCYREYYDFFDHYIPLSDRSMVEALDLAGFEVEKVLPRTLPLTFRSRLPSWMWLVRLYLRMPLAWRFFGSQFLAVGRKRAASRQDSPPR